MISQECLLAKSETFLEGMIDCRAAYSMSYIKFSASARHKFWMPGEREPLMGIYLNQSCYTTCTRRTSLAPIVHLGSIQGGRYSLGMSGVGNLDLKENIYNPHFLKQYENGNSSFR